MLHDFAVAVTTFLTIMSVVITHDAQQLAANVSNFLHPATATSITNGHSESAQHATAAVTTNDPFHATSTETAQPSEIGRTVEPASRENFAAAEQRPGKVLGANTEAQPPNNSLPLPSFVTHDELSAAVDAVAKNLQLQIARNVPVLTFSGPAATTPVNTATFAVSQKIDQLANVALTNATVDGLSGLTDADIPDSLTASNYLLLTGGTLTGDLTMSGTLTAGSLSVAGISSSGALIGPYVTATSTTATSTFSGGLFSNYGAFNSASFGATATSTFTSAGALGIGTTSPAASLDIFSSGSNLLNLTSSATIAQQTMTSYRNSSITHDLIFAQAARGTRSAPLTVLSGDALLSLRAGGWDGTSFLSPGSDASAAIDFSADEDFVSTANRAGKLVFYTLATGANNKTAQMTIKGSGNIGIGNSSPTYKLDVSGLGHFTGLVDAANFVATSTSVASTFAYNVGIGTTSPSAKLSITGGGTGTGRAFAIADSNNAEKLTVLDNGNVGIGTAAPGVTLDVNGIGSFGGVAGITNQYVTSQYPSVGFNSYRPAGSWLAGAAGYGGLWQFDNSAGTMIYYTGTNVSAGAAHTNTARMTIDSSGNVGIATTSPWRTLSVTGTVGFDGLTGSTGAGSLCLDSNKQVVYNSASDNCLSSTRATKHAIEGLSLDGLRIIDALQPVSFVYNQGDGRTRYGFIAEDTAAVDGHLATYDASGTVSGIDDRSIIAVLVGAMKELAATVRGFADKFITKELVATNGSFEHVRTNELCVGAICVTEDQFKAVFGNQSTPSAQTTAGAPAGGQGAPADAVVSDGGGTTATTAITTAPLDSSPTSAVFSPTNDNRQPEGAEQSSHDGNEPAATEEAPDTQLIEAPAETPPLPEPANDNGISEPLPATGT